MVSFCNAAECEPSATMTSRYRATHLDRKNIGIEHVGGSFGSLTSGHNLFGNIRREEVLRPQRVSPALSLFQQWFLKIGWDPPVRPALFARIAPAMHSRYISAKHCGDRRCAATNLNDCFCRFQHVADIAIFAIFRQAVCCDIGNIIQIANIASVSAWKR
jgi:hypothetical protein